MAKRSQRGQVQPQQIRKASITCQLCSEKVDDISLHLSLSHFKPRLTKLLPSRPPFKCPKCASVEDSHDGLIAHYGGQHKLNDRYLDEELKKLVTNGSKSNSPAPKVSSSSIECKLCNVSLVETQLKEHGLEAHFKDEILARLPKTPPFTCPQCVASRACDTFESLKTLSF